MARAVKRKQDQASDVSINMTPMIDIVFQLIIFFILATQFVSNEISEAVITPFPNDVKTMNPDEMNDRRVIINVLSKEDPKWHKEGEQVLPGELARYEINKVPISAFQADKEIRDIVEAAFNAAKEKGYKESDFWVEVRADYRVSYTYVAQALTAAGQAGVKNTHFTVRKVPIDE